MSHSSLVDRKEAFKLYYVVKFRHAQYVVPTNYWSQEDVCVVLPFALSCTSGLAASLGASVHILE